MARAGFVCPLRRGMSLLRSKFRHMAAVALVALVVATAVVIVRAQDPEAEETSELPAADPRPNILLMIADDWSWPHAGAYGDSVVRTPEFDRVANEGILFKNAFCPAPSCTPSRLSILTGQYPHRIEEGGNHMISFPKKFAVFPELLETAGYAVSRYNKGANFGSRDGTGWKHDPAGRDYGGLSLFLDNMARDRPFFFWWGSENPHRPYDAVTSTSSPDPGEVEVPGFLPDVPLVRRDLSDYMYEVQQFDREVKRAIDILEARDLLENTIVIVTSDNGMPFPRAKANCYDAGTRVPLAVMWQGKTAAGQELDDFINLSDLAPTILEAAGVEIPREMTGRSFYYAIDEAAAKKKFSWWDRLLRRKDPRADRDAVFVERERHGLGRGNEPGLEGHLSYPIRGIRTAEYLYLVNFRPHLWPACDPPEFVDVDPSRSKTAVLETRESIDPAISAYFDLSFGKRPKEELYDVVNDPFQLNNLADDPTYADKKKSLERRLKRWMADTKDPRANGRDDDRWDYYSYFEGDKPPYHPPRN